MRDERAEVGPWRGRRQKIKWDLWRPEDRPFARLLDALAGWNVWEDMLEVERNAASSQPMAEVLEQEQDVAEEQVEQARQELGTFREALCSAYRARPAEVRLDSGLPEQDQHAGALINYLVRTDFAQVRTEDLGKERYLYRIEVDWPRLERLATKLDLDLGSMLA